MGLEKLVQKMLKKKPELQQLLQQNPQLRDAFYGKMMEVYGSNKYLVDGGKFLDKFKRWMSAAQLGILGIAGPVVGSIPIAVLQLAKFVPDTMYNLYYTGKTRTKGIGGTAKSLARGALEYITYIPATVSSIAGIMPMYKRNAEEYIVNKTADDILKQYLPQPQQALKPRKKKLPQLKPAFA